MTPLGCVSSASRHAREHVLEASLGSGANGLSPHLLGASHIPSWALCLCEPVYTGKGTSALPGQEGGISGCVNHGSSFAVGQHWSLGPGTLLGERDSAAVGKEDKTEENVCDRGPGESTGAS